MFFSIEFTARRRAAAKRKKLKNLGKSKSTDTEEEDADDDCGDDGELKDYLILGKIVVEKKGTSCFRDEEINWFSRLVSLYYVQFDDNTKKKIYIRLKILLIDS